MGGIVMTNDGNAILREITVQHPAAKSMIEIARTQDEEVGDGTTSVIVLAGEILAVAEPFLQQQVHPTVIIRQFRAALEHIIELLDDDSWCDQNFYVELKKTDKETLHKVVSMRGKLCRGSGATMRRACIINECYELCVYFRSNPVLALNSLAAGPIWLLR